MPTLTYHWGRTMSYPKVRIPLLLGLLLALLLLAGCQNMREQPKLLTYEASPNFGSAARVPVAQALPVSSQRGDEHLYYGTIDGELATTFPMEVTPELLARGQQEFNAFCTPCHGFAGYGDGILSLEGFPKPASYHTDDLRNAPVGRLIQTMVYGKNAMFSYASRVEPTDRWAIAAYIRTLQFSQYANATALPQNLQDELAGLGPELEAKEASRVNVSE